ncbi:hypothetical protein [Legionella bononiensis]|uniref:hypothetical protein n=1 Tax=Legionella bononiensis TaxID=2793102 RepID=UPI0019324602|nr:hypothetical protein [Legionella bononiensis]MBL7478822.1 hypothetical protein [Legionella bononiensis]MBL7562454.1 hypothetical protein [Legionella bononiensis]
MKEDILTLAKEGNDTALLPLIKGTRFYYEAIKEAAKFKHIHLVNKLFEQLQFNPHASRTGLTSSELALINSAIEGYASGQHFEEVKKMVSLGGNIFHGLNALLTVRLLTPENALKLIDCAKDKAQETTLRDAIENTYDIQCKSVKDNTEGKDTAARISH